MLSRTALCIASLAAGLAAAPAPAADDIVETALGTGSFETLAAALDAAHLIDDLQGNGPFTVFAPTDDAFNRLPDGALAALLRPEARDRLTSILTFHVVPGRLTAEELVRRGRATTLNGQRFDVMLEGGGVMIDGARVRRADIQCSNGIIHVIDAVIMPNHDDIIEVASSAGRFGTLLAAAKAAGLAGVLRSDGPFTVLAPNDDAFAALPKGTVETLLEPGSRDQLTRILEHHVIPGRIFVDRAIDAGAAKTLQGDSVRFTIGDGRVRVNDANVLANDIDAANGVIHVIDRVLMPPSAETPSGRLVIGVYSDGIGAALAAQLGVDQDTALLVSRLVEGGNAEKAGVARYDVITAIDGRPATEDSLREAKAARGFGGTLELSVIRGGKPLMIRVPVGIDPH